MECKKKKRHLFRDLSDLLFHTHLQQPDVAWRQPREPVKHFQRWSLCQAKRRARSLPEILLLDSPDGKPTDGGSSPAGVTGPFSLRSAVWLRTAQSSLITSPFLTLRKWRPAGGVSKGIKGAGTHTARCCHKREGGFCRAGPWLEHQRSLAGE